MSDGAEWSANLDFAARFSNWEKPFDPIWPVVRSERAALTDLCIPRFGIPTSGHDLTDVAGLVITFEGSSGLQRAMNRYAAFDLREIQWQVELIRLSTRTILRSDSNTHLLTTSDENLQQIQMNKSAASESMIFLRAASDISRFLSEIAVRSGPGASWIGLDWLGHSGAARPAALGNDLYSGAPGVCLFLAAHSKVTGDSESRSLSLSGLSTLRHNLRGIGGHRFARGIGLGGSTGIGSILYALVTVGTLLNENALLEEAQEASSLVTPDLIATDQALDVFDGCAGGIMGLLRLFRATGDRNVLNRAAMCGDYLLSQPRLGMTGSRSWLGLTIAERAPDKMSRPLNGMSHGAAGFSLALAALANATHREEFAVAAEECIAYENSSFSREHSNWPDFRLRGSEIDPAWLCQWCHGAAGIGLSRIGVLRFGNLQASTLRMDILNATSCVLKSWPYPGDNLCCGRLGNIEFLNEAAVTLEDSQLRNEASQRMTSLLASAQLNGEYVFEGIDRRFDVGLFRGIAGIGYSLLRQVNSTLPSVLIWE